MSLQRLMPPLWNVRMYNRGDEAGILNLMNLVFAPTLRREMDLWLWEYKDNINGSLEVVAECQEQIVGHMGLIGVELKVADHIIRGAQAVDLTVHPSFRRHGVFLQLGKTLMENATKGGVQVVYGFPNGPAYHGHVKYGWFYVCRIPVLTKFLDRRSLIRFLFIRLYYFIRRRYSSISGQQSFQLMRYLRSVRTWIRVALVSRKEISKTPSTRRAKFQVREISSFDARLDDLWSAVSKQFAVAVERKAEYLNWRYFEKPGSRYCVFVAERDGSLQGYIVLHIAKPWDWAALSLKKLGYIVDVVATSKAAIECLVNEATRYFVREQADLILCWMLKGHFAYRYLIENGFQYDRTLQEAVLICRINTPIPQSPALAETLRESENWFLTIGDSDLV